MRLSKRERQLMQNAFEARAFYLSLDEYIANEPETLECKHDDQVANLTAALNDLLEKAKLCKECNQVFNSLSDAIEQAEKVVEGKV